MGTGRIRGRRTKNDFPPSFSLHSSRSQTRSLSIVIFTHIRTSTRSRTPHKSHTLSQALQLHPTTLPSPPQLLPLRRQRPNPPQHAYFRSQSMHHHASPTRLPIPPPLGRRGPRIVQLTTNGGGDSGGEWERESPFFKAPRIHPPSQCQSSQPQSTTGTLFSITCLPS
jgi:hypothetical protein